METLRLTDFGAQTAKVREVFIKTCLTLMMKTTVAIVNQVVRVSEEDITLVQQKPITAEERNQ